MMDKATHTSSSLSVYERPPLKSPMVKRRKNGTTSSVKNVQVAVLGKDGVGKSAFTVRALTRRFIGEYDTTLECTYRHHVELDGQFLSLDVLDTAGKNSLEKVDNCVHTGSDLFFVLYSTTDRSSFEEASLLCRYLLKTKNINPACLILLGNKTDLKHFREVDEYEGRLLAQALECGFHQLSVSEGFVDSQNVLYNTLRQFVNSQKQGSPSIRLFFDNVLSRKKSVS
ncbi:ras-related and estrogen-regulated growth inhibitor-like [Acropora muricata]